MAIRDVVDVGFREAVASWPTPDGMVVAEVSINMKMRTFYCFRFVLRSKETRRLMRVAIGWRPSVLVRCFGDGGAGHLRECIHCAMTSQYMEKVAKMVSEELVESLKGGAVP